MDITLETAADKLVKEIFGVKPEETVIITADDDSDASVVEAVKNSAKNAGAHAMVISVPTPGGVGKAADPDLPVDALSAALLCADVWIEFNHQWLLYSTPFERAEAENKKMRYMCLVDFNPDLMIRTIGNVETEQLKKFMLAITEKTKVICPVHYAGVACEMDAIMDIAKRHQLMVVEDAAQGVMSTYKGKALGTIGDFGCYSFHETKNYSMGEGGCLLIRDEKNIEDAEIIREKGTNRSKFFRGQIDKYTWVEAGSSYLPSDMNAAYLYAQLEVADKIYDDRMSTWNTYYENLTPLKEAGYIELPVVPEGCVHNAHMFYIKAKDLEERSALIKFLKENGISSVFHYIPLHGAPAGQKFGRFHGEDKYTTKESERLLRLPLYYGLEKEKVLTVCEKIKEFYSK